MCLRWHIIRNSWLHVIIMSHMSFRVNPLSIVCLNVKEFFTLSRCHIWSLSESNLIWTHYHLVHKWTLNHLAKLAKWLSCVVSTYCMVHLTVCYHVAYKFQSESTLCSLPECQGTPCSKQSPYLKFKWQQHDSSSSLVVKALDSQSRSPVFKITGWLQGRLSLSSFQGR